MKLIKKTLLITSLLSYVSGFALQKSKDFNEILKSAIKSSPQYKYIYYQLKGQQENDNISIGELLPNANLSASTSRSVDYTSDKYKSSAKALISLEQPLIDYGKLEKYFAANAGVQYSEQDYRNNYQQFLYDLSYAYFNLAKATKNLKYNFYNRKAAKANLNELTKKYKAGTALTVDYETSKSNYYIANADYVSAKRDVKIAQAELYKFTKNNDDILLYKNDFKLINPNFNSKEKWKKLAIHNNPSYLGALYNEESKYYDYKSVARTFFPSVNLELDYTAGDNSRYSLGNTVLDSQLTTDDGVSAFYIGIKLKWQLFNASNFPRTKLYAADYQASHYSTLQISRAMTNDTEYTYKYIEYKKNQIESLRIAAKSAKVSYEKYKDMYLSGLTTITQYFIQLNNYYKILISLNNTEADYILGFLTLYKTTGTLTPEIINSLNNWVLLNKKVELK